MLASPNLFFRKVILLPVHLKHRVGRGSLIPMLRETVHHVVSILRATHHHHHHHPRANDSKELLVVGSSRSLFSLSLKKKRLISGNAALPQLHKSLGYLFHTIWPGLCTGFFALQATKQLQKSNCATEGDKTEWKRSTVGNENTKVDVLRGPCGEVVCAGPGL